MANKTVVLKDSAGNNIYPNVVKENLPASAVFYGDEAAGPEGGVETPSGGNGSGEAAFDILTLSSDNSYTGTITGTKPILINVRDVVLQLSSQTIINDDNSVGVQTSDLNPDGTFTTTQLSNGTISSSSVPLYYYHFITLTNDHDFLYLQYFNPHDDKINSDGGMPFSIETLKTALFGKKVVCTGVLGNSDETLATPLYVSGEADGLKVYYVLKNDTSGTITSKSIAAFTISDVVKPIE